MFQSLHKQAVSFKGHRFILTDLAILEALKDGPVSGLAEMRCRIVPCDSDPKDLSKKISIQAVSLRLKKLSDTGFLEAKREGMKASWSLTKKGKEAINKFSETK